MWGVNDYVEIEKITGSNQYLNILNVYVNKEKATQGETQNNILPAGQEIAAFSPEAAAINPIQRENEEDKKAEDQRKIDEERDKAMNEIDRKMMEILSRVKQDPKLKEMAIENFDKAKEIYQMRPSTDNYTNWSKPSMIVLELLSQDNRFPIEYQQAWGDLLKEYQQIMSPEFDKQALNVKSAWTNALRFNGLKLTA